MSSFARENETKEASFSSCIYIYIASSFAVGYECFSCCYTRRCVFFFFFFFCFCASSSVGFLSAFFIRSALKLKMYLRVRVLIVS